MAKSLGLWLQFKVKENVYAIDCAYVKYIGVVNRNELTQTTDDKEYISGFFNLNNEIITLINLRKIFGFDDLDKEITEFVDMLELRKQEHEEWARTLKNCIETRKEFTLSTDPHRWNFGMWYDNYKSDHSFVNFQLQKIDDPHQEFHALAKNVNALIHSDDPKAKDELNNILKALEEEYVPTIIGLLEDTEAVFRTSLREMFVSINEKTVSMAISMDEVLGIEKLDVVVDGKGAEAQHLPDYIEGVARDKDGKLIMIVDVPKVLSMTE